MVGARRHGGVGHRVIGHGGVGSGGVGSGGSSIVDWRQQAEQVIDPCDRAIEGPQVVHVGVVQVDQDAEEDEEADADAADAAQDKVACSL